MMTNKMEQEKKKKLELNVLCKKGKTINTDEIFC